VKLLHVSLIVSDLEQAEKFYGGLLGLQRDDRPELGFHGIFYRLHGGQQLHVMQLDNPYDGCVLPAHGGRDRHVAFAVDDIAQMAARLAAAGVAITRSRSGRQAIFCRDADGNAIELVAV